MQKIRTKQAEDNYNLRQYNFLAGRLKTAPLACRWEYWIQSQKQSSR
jgi:hypothetical protein